MYYVVGREHVNLRVSSPTAQYWCSHTTTVIGPGRPALQPGVVPDAPGVLRDGVAGRPDRTSLGSGARRPELAAGGASLNPRSRIVVQGIAPIPVEGTHGLLSGSANLFIVRLQTQPKHSPHGTTLAGSKAVVGVSPGDLLPHAARCLRRFDMRLNMHYLAVLAIALMIPALLAAQTQ